MKRGTLGASPHVVTSVLLEPQTIKEKLAMKREAKVKVRNKTPGEP